MHIRLDNMLN